MNRLVVLLSFAAFACLIPTTPAIADPVPIAVGSGSYASEPPADVGGDVLKTLSRPLNIIDLGDRPVPTNRWWTNMIVNQWTGNLWALPEMVKADEHGVNFYYPQQWNSEGRDPVTDNPLVISGADFQPVDTRAKTWGDWTLTFRLEQDSARYIDITLGRGMPYAWFEYNGVQPAIDAPPDATAFDIHGAPIGFPYAGERFGLTFAGRSYGVFAPAGSRFERSGRTITGEFGSSGHYLVVCALPSPDDLAMYAKYAYAIPRDSRMDWTYDPNSALVTTRWHVTTQPLQGSNTDVFQGWLPHHYRDTENNLAFNGVAYLTPRGTMKCAPGNDFVIKYGFTGFLPFLPRPQKLGLPHDFDPDRMHDYITRYSTRSKYGDDTYWGGKSLTQYGDYMAMAHEMQDPAFDTLRAELRTALADWYTYTPGESAHYFARYDRWHAMIGMKPSYGSESFNDNHFHYGYFTRSTALLGLFDPNFLKDYGGMARLVAKEYANWDRTDLRFPFLRTFDVWEGHSWAGGFSSPTGNNQESSSEAMQSWCGLFLLGEALGDDRMISAAAMGYAMESRATLEYWFNVHSDNFSPKYQWPISGMVWNGGHLFGTYFSGDPAWVYGIQWLPMQPGLDYLVRYPDYARESFHKMMDLQLQKKGSNDIGGMGSLGNVVLSFAQLINPDWVAEEMDDLWDSNNSVAHDNDTPGLTYYMTHADRRLGDIQWDYHMSDPLSTVYKNPRTGAMNYVVYNPGPATEIRVYKGDSVVGKIPAPAASLVDVQKLNR